MDTTTNIFLWTSRFTSIHLLCHNVEGAHDISVAKNSGN